jgi:hypothetical protein
VPQNIDLFDIAASAISRILKTCVNDANCTQIMYVFCNGNDFIKLATHTGFAGGR